MENWSFQDVFPIETGDIPLAILVYQSVSLLVNQNHCGTKFDGKKHIIPETDSNITVNLIHRMGIGIIHLHKWFIFMVNLGNYTIHGSCG